eukprot:CAMPEP_0184737604 /NCGR_PEP_ID=MMETSP0315-20130426/395_1 /TAXON_ID=101924 /ORGANISM="Rhodosorus marinus, Strain UTEX LB 2760" /LENGTH=141 /DNA_ID=CAMNT_0027204891 /DNA_START=65 /DNA_END=490 /DNA_ORIENTATION=+
MVKVLKTSKVVIVLSGKYAGKKAVIVQNYDQGTSEHPYGHALVCGIEKYPMKVTKNMGEKKVQKRSKIKTFVKAINYNHLMPTRYTFELGETVTSAAPAFTNSDVSVRTQARKDLRKVFANLSSQRYKGGKNQWFFTKLRF